MSRIVMIASALVALAACAAEDTGEPVPFTDDCLDLPEQRAYECAEDQFWTSFQIEHDRRFEVYELFGAVLADHPEFEHSAGRANVAFRRGQLALAIALESDPPNPAFYISRIGPDFDLTAELDPENTIVVSWQASIEIAIAHVTGDDALAIQLFDEAEQRILSDPLGNVPSISGTSIGLPMSTGVPQRTIAMIDGWECRDVAWCDQNTEHGPWVMPGMAYHWAEHYARVGNREKTSYFLEQSRAAPGFDQWPYNYITEQALDDVDGLLDRFAAVGEDGSAFNLMYANAPYGCVFCHAP